MGSVPDIQGFEVSETEAVNDIVGDAEDTVASENDDSVQSPALASAVLEHIARSLVESADGVRVEVVEGSPRTQLNLYVADGDMGRIIGKRGRTASAIRTVTRAAAARDGVAIDVEFID